jgi:threonine dehydrogenase-like Zn-dependent dehydrogenase
MNAIVFQDGRVRFERGYPVPVPGKEEVLVRVSLAGICATDLEIVKGYMGFEGVLGHEFVGEVQAPEGSNLIGRRVVGEINIGCGDCDFCLSGLMRHCPGRSVLGISGSNGAFAEYLTLPVSNLHVIPDSIADEEAVFVEPLAAAFEIAEQVDIEASNSILVLGDGRLGLLAAQVLATCSDDLLVIGRHRRNLAILKARGIQTAVDPGSVTAGALAAGKKFDIVIDCTGTAAGLEAAMSLVNPRGKIVLKTTVAAHRRLDFNRLVIDEITLIGSRCGPFPPAIEALAEKKIDVKPMIDAVYPLEEGEQALRQAGKKGALKILLKI